VDEVLVESLDYAKYAGRKHIDLSDARLAAQARDASDGYNNYSPIPQRDVSSGLVGDARVVSALLSCTCRLPSQWPLLTLSLFSPVSRIPSGCSRWRT